MNPEMERFTLVYHYLTKLNELQTIVTHDKNQKFMNDMALYIIFPLFIFPLIRFKEFFKLI